jgi:hypothetical protein
MIPTSSKSCNASEVLTGLGWGRSTTLWYAFKIDRLIVVGKFGCCLTNLLHPISLEPVRNNGSCVTLREILRDRPSQRTILSSKE